MTSLPESIFWAVQIFFSEGADNIWRSVTIQMCDHYEVHLFLLRSRSPLSFSTLLFCNQHLAESSRRISSDNAHPKESTEALEIQVQASLGADTYAVHHGIGHLLLL